MSGGRRKEQEECRRDLIWWGSIAHSYYWVLNHNCQFLEWIITFLLRWVFPDFSSNIYNQNFSFQDLKEKTNYTNQKLDLSKPRVRCVENDGRIEGVGEVRAQPSISAWWVLWRKRGRRKQQSLAQIERAGEREILRVPACHMVSSQVTAQRAHARMETWARTVLSWTHTHTHTKWPK